MDASAVTIIEKIAQSLGTKLLRHTPVSGGDINAAWLLTTDKGHFFVKTNTVVIAEAMFAAEAEGLKALQQNFAGTVSDVIAQGSFNGTAWLALQWLEKGTATETAMRNFGAQLAEMHRRPQPYFGWQTDNFIGRLTQANSPAANWAAFYAQQRILPLVKTLVDSGRWGKQEMQQADSFCRKLPDLMPEEPPALLHGDLWGGNYMITSQGVPAIFDPAVYGGHREMDLGMTKLFGGFDPGFYEGYQATYPLQPGWEQRLPITQLYPLLVHAVLFGGHYIAAAENILRRFASFPSLSP